MLFVPYSAVFIFLSMLEMYASSIGCNVFEFFRVPLYTEFLSDLYKKFQVASRYGTDTKFDVFAIICILVMLITENTHTRTNTRTNLDRDQTIKIKL